MSVCLTDFLSSFGRYTWLPAFLMPVAVMLPARAAGQQLEVLRDARRARHRAARADPVGR
ncbi:hypothetical protein AB0C13_40050 [Streptomyces sp. NPDC049099]|uniref:hypothetical protein n=1 Tax=Streptomyces sp. NPDC049099 TaxID=3155768 RepID=UPI0034393756